MADGDLIYFRAPSGLVIGMTLPLHESIVHQWRTGELQRCEEDGSPWQGDDDVLPGEPSPDGAGDEGEAAEFAEPERPAGNASRSTWQDYAVALGAVTEDEAAGMNRQELIDAATPPEMKPPEG